MASNDSSYQINIWNGQDIGDITSNIVVSKDIIQSKLGKAAIFGNDNVVILKYNVLPIIINNIKRHFCIYLNKYLTCSINNKKSIICKYSSGILTLRQFSFLPHPFFDENDTCFMEDIQKCIAFRYLFFLADDDESIYMHPLDGNIYSSVLKKITAIPVSTYETSYDLSNKNFPQYSISRFFNSDNEKFKNIIVKMLNNQSINEIRENIISIILRYDNIDNYMEWIDAVCNRISQFI